MTLFVFLIFAALIGWVLDAFGIDGGWFAGLVVLLALGAGWAISAWIIRRGWRDHSRDYT